MSSIQPVNKAMYLEQLCEGNYQKLLRLIPGLMSIDDHTIGCAEEKPSLHVQIQGKTTYTLTLTLSHSFDGDDRQLLEPAVKIRVYRDAGLVEVLRDHARPPVAQVYRNPGQSREIMDYKWSLNYFLSKWLDHCLQTDYAFSTLDLPVAAVGEVC